MTPEDYEKAVLQRFRTLWPPPRFVVEHNIRLSGRKTKAGRQVDVGIFETGESQPFLIVEAKRHKRPIDAGMFGTRRRWPYVSLMSGSFAAIRLQLTILRCCGC
jgi:hypothetical protein